MSAQRSPAGNQSIPLVIASPLEADLVQVIRSVDARLDVMYDPALLARPRYAADHGGEFSPLDSEENDRWHSMLARAEIAFDFDRREPGRMRSNCPQLRWIQASSAGVGQVIPRFDLNLDRVVVTTSAGVHAEPLAEFVLAALLYFVKEFPFLRAQQSGRIWNRYTTNLLAGRRVLVVGMGSVGRCTAHKLAALGVDVVAAVRPGSGIAGDDDFRSVVDTTQIDGVVGDVDAVVVACPLTEQTEGLISPQTFGAMRPGTFLVNVARGQVVDEPAMIEQLRAGRLGGAALDVAWTEPLPPDSLLWDMENVLISPHSASTVSQENQLIVELFCDNIHRWLAGSPLRNVYDPNRGY